MIKVRVKVQKNKEGVEKRGDEYIVWTKKAPEKGKANNDVLKQIAKELGISVSMLSIERGHTSSIKYIKKSS